MKTLSTLQGEGGVSGGFKEERGHDTSPDGEDEEGDDFGDYEGLYKVKDRVSRAPRASRRIRYSPPSHPLLSRELPR